MIRGDRERESDRGKGSEIVLRRERDIWGQAEGGERERVR